MKREKTMTGKNLSFAVLLIPALVLFAWRAEAGFNRDNFRELCITREVFRELCITGTAQEVKDAIKAGMDANVRFLRGGTP